jgi:hypothetical protein
MLLLYISCIAGHLKTDGVTVTMFRLGALLQVHGDLCMVYARRPFKFHIHKWECRMIIKVSPRIKAELLGIRKFCESPDEIPCLAYGKCSRESTEPFQFFVGTISKKEERPSGVCPLITFIIDGIEVGIQCPEEFHLLNELHFDYRDGRLVNLPMAVVDAVATSPVIYYVHTDHLGRPWR